MKTIKKILLLTVLITILVCTFSIIANAATYGDLTYEVSGGKVTITDCSTYVTSVTIPSKINGYPVTSIGDFAFKYCTGLTSITIPDSVTSIGAYAFYNCTSLASVTIGNNVTSIGEWAFEDCKSLTSIEIPDSVTSIGANAFENCTSLASVYITDLAKWCQISFGSYDANPLYYAKKLYINNVLATDITIPDSVTSIGDFAFYNCTSLKSIEIPASVTSIGAYAFYNCTSLANVTIPDSVTSIGYMAFYDCTSLASIEIPDGVTSIGDDAFYNTAYYNNSSNWDDNVLYIGNHLIQAKTSIEGNYTVKDGTKCISDDAFYNCKSLTSIEIPDSVTSIGRYAFYNCTSLTSITIPDSVTSIGDDAFQYCKSLASITIPDSVTSIGSSAFSGCTSLASITIPDSVTSIGSYAFSNCTSLKSIEIPDSVTSIGSSAFYNCSASRYYNGSSIQWSKVSNPSSYSVTCKFDGDYIALNGETDANAGDELSYDAHFSSSYNIDYLISTIKYPKTFAIKEITNKDFEDNTIDTEYSDDEFGYVTIISTYSFDGERTEQYKGYTPYEIVFEVSETCPLGTYTLEFVDETIALGDGDYTLIIDSVDVFVPDTLTIYGADEISGETQFTVRGVNTENVPVVWSVDDENVATISNDGVVTPITNGTVVITATYTENDTVFATKTVTVNDCNDCNVTDILIIGDDTVYDGEKYYAKLYPENLNHKTVTWSVDNTEVATITDDGVLTAVGAGTVKVKATVNDATAFSKEMTVTIPSINAVIDTLSSDVGTWDKEFVPYERNYTITVPKDTTSISLTGSFTGGSLKCNTTTMLNGRARSIDLTDDITILTLYRSNVTGKNESSYTVTVVRSVTHITANVTVVNCKYHFEVDTIALPEGYESASVVVAVYDENGTFVTMQTKSVTADDTTATFDFDVEDVYSYQVMLFDALGNMKPLSTNVKKQI